MKISVCMATHNGEKYVFEQVESILRQLGTDDEIIISDDSSTDRTVDIVSGFGDGRIHIFEGNTYFNPIFNFENALKKSTGDLIVLSDQDDIWMDNKIEVIRDKFQFTSPIYHLVVLDGEIIDETGIIIDESIFKKINSGRGLLKNIYDNTYMGCCMAFSRSLLDIALPFPKRIPMHDMWLGLLAEMFGTVDFVEAKTIRYRKHGKNMTCLYRQFKPMLQIERRFFLVYQLAVRFIERRLSNGLIFKEKRSHD